MNPAPKQNGRPMRSLLACLPCRSRHLKCDSKRPCCTRCTEGEKQCQYAQSRRGGLDRAALAERRKRLAAAEESQATSSLESSPVGGQQTLAFTDADILDDSGLLDNTSVSDFTSGTASPAIPPFQVDNIDNDSFVNAYYDNFHKLHPFVLPRGHLQKLYQCPSRRLSFKPLVAVLRFIGHIYTSREWPSLLRAAVDGMLSQASKTDPITVQCRLLYSIALFWSGYKADAQRELSTAAGLARELGMFRGEFATERGSGDPIIIECWRRTWWMLYIVDIYFAGSLGTMTFTVLDIDATVDLPCEEAEYESGDIPNPKSLQDFDDREFASEDISFSSFAYLIGAVRCAASAISISPKIANKEASEHVIQAIDSIIDGWLLLLPKGSKEVMSKSGEIDELMFQAHLFIHVATIGVHRPLSDLKFNAVEDVSSCARDRPFDTPTPDLVNVHTVRVLRSAESQIRILALPARPFYHTPFVTCMVSEGTLAMLSACNFLLKGKELAVVRDQIRMTIGCLRSLGEIWSQTARIVQEIQTIARHVLRLKARSDTPHSSTVPSLSGCEGLRESESEAELTGLDVFSGVQDLDSIWGWHSLDDRGIGRLWWVDSGS
ncbi:hypothetical protein BGZ63DRAFT_415868 [Mariannaea sp. PMI_226]|nr:hypothetical protein BGZ63DRAFT_415868 [Mariannaea sp. PMI_226]